MAFRYRLYSTPAQEEGCVRHCADARFVWNLALEQANAWRPGRVRSPGRAERFRQLAEARRGSWLGEGSSSVQQQALRDFDQALRNWWGGTHRRPRWRRRRIDEGFVSATCPYGGPPASGPRSRSPRSAGSASACPDRSAPTAWPGDRRRDWAEKTSTRLVTDYDLVVFEDLRVKAMLRSARGNVDHPGRNVAAKAALNRRIAAAAWSTLVRRTRQKAEASAGCEVVLVDPRHTSQECSACGHTTAENRPSQAVFSCVACGHAAHADINAAINIRARGLRVPARGGRPEVRAPSETRTTDEEAA